MTQEIGDKIKQEVTQQGNTGHRGDDFTRQNTKIKFVCSSGHYLILCLFIQTFFLDSYMFSKFEESFWTNITYEIFLHQPPASFPRWRFEIGRTLLENSFCFQEIDLTPRWRVAYCCVLSLSSSITLINALFYNSTSNVSASLNINWHSQAPFTPQSFPFYFTK